MYYGFEKKTDTYVKDGTEESYEQTTSVDKTDKVITIIEQLFNLKASYLRRRQHVDNIFTVLP